MYRNVYLTGIVCFSIVTIFGCFWLINSFIHGTEFNEFVTFPKLVVIDGIIVLLCEITLLLYFYSKKYKVAFVASLLSAITFSVLYTTLYRFFWSGGSGNFINQAVAVHLAAVTTYSFSLVFSKASERPLLKKAGYVGVVVGLILLPINLIGLYLPEGATLDMLININMVVGRLGDLVVVFYILNFYRELRPDVESVLKV